MQVEQHVLDAFLNESATLSLPGDQRTRRRGGERHRSAAARGDVGAHAVRLPVGQRRPDLRRELSSDWRLPERHAAGDASRTGPAGREPYRSTCLDFGANAVSGPMQQRPGSGGELMVAARLVRSRAPFAVNGRLRTAADATRRASRACRSPRSPRARPLRTPWRTPTSTRSSTVSSPTPCAARRCARSGASTAGRRG